jgi:hypothetical protein
LFYTVKEDAIHLPGLYTTGIARPVLELLVDKLQKMENVAFIPRASSA